MSLWVMSPCTLPYSSVTIAMWAPCCLKVSSTRGADMVSGTKTAGCSSGRRSKRSPVMICTSRSFDRTMPMTFSASCSTTGKRERWLAAILRSTSAGESSTSSDTMRVRGVITMPAVRSPRCRTPSSMSCSASSKTPPSVPWLMSTLSSSGVMIGSFDGFARRTHRTAFVDSSSRRTTGDAARDSIPIGPATKEAMRSGWFRAIRFGTSSPMTSEK